MDSRDMQKLYDQAVALVRKTNTASTSLLQRRLLIGYSVAAGLMDRLEANGVVGPFTPSTGRSVLAKGGETGGEA